jgi:hypothetical protein
MKNSSEVGTDVVKTTIRIRRELWKKVLHHSIDENQTQQEIVEQALEEYLKKSERRK